MNTLNVTKTKKEYKHGLENMFIIFFIYKHCIYQLRKIVISLQYIDTHNKSITSTQKTYNNTRIGSDNSWISYTGVFLHTET